MKLKHAIGASILGLFVSATASAEESRERRERTEVIEVEVEFEKRSWWDNIRPVVSVRGGFDYAKPGGSTVDIPFTLPGTGESPDAYVPIEKWHTAGVWGALLGVEIPVWKPGNRWQTGVSYYGTGDFHVEGIVDRQSNISLGETDYKYKVRNTRVLWENRWLTAMNNWFDLYFLVGIGWSQNKASDYKETLVYEFAIPNEPFEDKTKNSFTYSLGFGMEAALTDHIRAGIGYQYSDLGRVELGHSPSQTSTENFSTSQTPAHEVLGSLTYIF
jgi:hypothetical protein